MANLWQKRTIKNKFRATSSLARFVKREASLVKIDNTAKLIIRDVIIPTIIELGCESKLNKIIGLMKTVSRKEVWSFWQKTKKTDRPLPPPWQVNSNLLNILSKKWETCWCLSLHALVSTKIGISGLNSVTISYYIFVHFRPPIITMSPIFLYCLNC